jgi:hypothetical protein
MSAIMSEEIPILPEYASELEAELACGKPFHYDPELGIHLMKSRIQGLLAEISAALDGSDQSADYLNAVRRSCLLRKPQRQCAKGGSRLQNPAPRFPPSPRPSRPRGLRRVVGQFLPGYVKILFKLEQHIDPAKPSITSSKPAIHSPVWPDNAPFPILL